MSKGELIVTDLSKYDRLDEITSATSEETVKNVISRLKQTLYDHPDTAALCSSQIGENLRLFVVRKSKEEAERFKSFLNPMIVSCKGCHLSREATPSIPGKEFIIPRFDEIHVAYQEADGHVNSESFIGAYGEVVQQMIDMLDGILLDQSYYDKENNSYLTIAVDMDDLAYDGMSGIEAFDAATDEEKIELMKILIENRKRFMELLQKEISEDPSMDNLNKTIDFMKGMLMGDIVPIKPEETETNSKEKTDGSTV